MKVELLSVYGYPNRRFAQVTVGPWQWDWFDWSLARNEGSHWQQAFSLRCGTCRQWSLGCGRHYFCGQCPACVPHEDE